MKRLPYSLRLTFVVMLLGLLIICTAATTQSSTEHPSPFEFVLVDSTAGTRADLFVKAETWIARTFNSSKDVIEFQDKEAGRIVGKLAMTCTVNESVSHIDFMNFIITIDTKDKKYRCVLSGFWHEGGTLPNGKGQAYSFGDLNQSHVRYQDPKFQGVKKVASRKSQVMLSDFRAFMNSKEVDF